MIPKKFYFTYKTDKPPEKYLGNLQHWYDFHPDWELHYFSDQQIYTFFENHFPEYREDLPKIPHGAVLADVFRYGVLYVQGGMYNDIDTLPLRKIPEEWLKYEAIVGYEYQPSKFSECVGCEHGERDVLCQWSILSSPKHPIFKEALDVSFEKLRQKNFHLQTWKDNLRTVGPLMFTDIVNKYMNRSEILILDLDYFGSSNRYLPITERSVVKHLFHGFERWKREHEFPHLKFY